MHLLFYAATSSPVPAALTRSSHISEPTLKGNPIRKDHTDFLYNNRRIGVAWPCYPRFLPQLQATRNCRGDR